LRRLRERSRLALQLSGLAHASSSHLLCAAGATLDLRRLATDPSALALAGAMAAGSVWARVAMAGRERRVATGLLASPQLGLPAAAAALGTASHALSPAVAAALIVGGCLTLVPASIGTRCWAGRRRPGAADRGRRRP
jgi:hypothetical protein